MPEPIPPCASTSALTVSVPITWCSEPPKEAGQILQGLDGKLAPGRDWKMEVTDEAQNTLYVLHIHAREARHLALIYRNTPERHRRQKRA